MKSSVVAFFAGALMAVALGFAGMTQPAKIIAFLDFFGDWDPSLLLVMGGAVAVYFVGFRLIMKKSHPIFAAEFQMPIFKKIDWKLIGGAMIFGIGWGMSGFCPGPALASLATGMKEVLIFVLAVAGGQLIFALIQKRLPE